MLTTSMIGTARPTRNVAVTQIVPVARAQAHGDINRDCPDRKTAEDLSGGESVPKCVKDLSWRMGAGDTGDHHPVSPQCPLRRG
jgi:hypothetical protein